MIKHIREIELDRDENLMTIKILILKDQNEIINHHFTFVCDELLNNPFGFDSNEVVEQPISFDDAQFIDNEYVVIQECENWINDQRIVDFVKTYFNSKKQVIKIEEKSGEYYNYTINFKYDEDDYLIEENIDGESRRGYYKLEMTYQLRFDKKKGEMDKKLICSDYNEGNIEEYFSYSEYGDILSNFTVEKRDSRIINIEEDQYFYNYNKEGDWTESKHFKNGNLVKILKREYGDFSEYLPGGTKYVMPF